MELPPQIVKHQVRSLAAGQDALAPRAGGGVQAFGNRLPVLQAFQEFLEIERRKARRRLIATGFVFLVILLAVVATASVLFARFAGRVDAEVRELERALAIARDEARAVRDDGESMRRSLDAAQQALDALRARVERESSRAPTIDLAVFATSLEALRKLQDLQPEYNEWSRRIEALEREAGELDALRKTYAARRMAWRAEWRALMSRVEAHETHRRAAAARLAEALARLGPSATPADRGRSRRRPASESSSADPAPAWLAMEELNQSKFNLPPLVMELDRLEREAVALFEARRDMGRQADAWRAAVLDVTDGIMRLRSRGEAIGREFLAEPRSGDSAG